jgi:hypothetical protein
MGRIEFENFSDRTIIRIYIAKNIREAEKIENLLTDNDIDYAISLEPFLPPSLLQSERMGAAFYVQSGQESICRQLIEGEGMQAGLIYE